MKRYITTLIIFAYAFSVNAQALNIINASSNVTDAAAKKFEVIFNSTQNLAGVDITPMNIWVKVPDAEAAGTSIAFTAGNNPFSFLFASTFSSGGFTYINFQTVTPVSPATFPLGVDVFMGELQVTGPATNVTLNGADFGNMGSGSNWAGTAVVQGTDNLLVWPLTSSVILPIKLNSFTAEVFQERSGKLDWSTETEINGSHFEIMRSTDTENWEQIGTVQAVGESYETQNYSLIDQNVGMLRNNATYYYQLKMVDLDGSYEMSDVRSITFNAEGIQVHTYPNPTLDKLFVNMITEKSLGDGVAEVLILDNSGKLLQKDKISVNGISEINVINVPSGLFMIRIMYADKVFTKKLVKIQ